MFIIPTNLAVQTRRHLFHEQAFRFRRCEERQPTRDELRALWKETSFRVL